MSIFGTPAKASNFHSGSASSIALAGTGGVSGGISTSTGDLIVVFFWGSNITTGQTATQVQDTIGNSYTIKGSPSTTDATTPVGNANTQEAAGTGFVAYCLSSIGTNAHNVITATFGSANGAYQGISVLDIPLSGGTAAFDVVKFGAVNTSTTTPTSLAFSTAGTDEAVYVGMENDFTGFTYTAGASYTIAETGSSGTGFMGTEYLTTPFTSPQTNITPSIHSSSSSQGTIIAIGFMKGTSPISATIVGTSTVTAAGKSYGFVSSTIAGKATVTAALTGKGALAAIIHGAGVVTAALTGAGALAASILGKAVVTAILKGKEATAAVIRGTSVVTVTGKTNATIVASGFSPNLYFAPDTAGLGIWVATGTINGIRRNGQFVAVPAKSTTQINVDLNGNIVFGASRVGLFPIAIVVSGLVITSGNTPSSTPFGGAFKIPPYGFGYETYSDGILSVTDIRPTTEDYIS